MNKCIVCGAPLMKEELMSLENMPIGAQTILQETELSDDKGIALALRQCSGCGLVQFDCEPVPYYRDVIRAGGFSTTMVELRREQYAHFIEMCGLENKKIIEIGCGRGEFLSVLKEFPVQGFGIEHRKDLADIARKSGLAVWDGFAENGETVLEGGPFDAFLSFNFLEHQPRPGDMLRCIYNNLKEQAYGLVTVPSFEYIIENGCYYELLRDHIANYTEETLRFVLEMNGFSVMECTMVNRDTLSAIVKKKPRTDINVLAQNQTELTEELRQFVKEKKSSGKKTAVWGASHQGFTILSTTGIGDDMEYIIDSAPFKQGLFSPASHLRIVAPDHFFSEPVEVILVIAPGYSEEISRIIRDRFGSGVEIAVLKSDKLDMDEDRK